MNKKMGIALLAGSLGVAALAAPVWAGSGQLMDLTIHVKETMAGMAPMPPRTLQKKICTQPGQFDPQAFVAAQSKSDCKITNYKRDGKTVTFDEVCTAPMAVTSHGVFHLADGQDFTGTMHTAFSAAGRAVTVDTDYTGKQDGSCDYQPKEKL
jgi:hypothetical protein